MESVDLKRNVLPDDKQQQVGELLQSTLFDLIDLALQGKQAHWNVTGRNFRSVHLQLDEIIDSLRTASDEVAERIVTIGLAADGRAQSVASESGVPSFPEGEVNTETVVSEYANRLSDAIGGIRGRIEQLGDLDPISEDMLIGISAELEKHLWMLQAQER